MHTRSQSLVATPLLSLGCDLQLFFDLRYNLLFSFLIRSLLVRILALLHSPLSSLESFFLSFGIELFLLHSKDTLIAWRRLVQRMDTRVEDVHLTGDLNLNEGVENSFFQCWVDKCLAKVITIFVKV